MPRPSTTLRKYLIIWVICKNVNVTKNFICIYSLRNPQHAVLTIQLWTHYEYQCRDSWAHLGKGKPSTQRPHPVIINCRPVHGSVARWEHLRSTSSDTSVPMPLGWCFFCGEIRSAVNTWLLPSSKQNPLTHLIKSVTMWNDWWLV